MLDVLVALSALAFGLLLAASLYFSRSSAPAHQVHYAGVLWLIAFGTQLATCVVAALSDAFGWISVAVTGGIAVFCLLAAGWTWARAGRMGGAR